MQRLREIRFSPIYQRERGRWGEPNAYYQQLNRYTPLVILGVIVLGLCCGGNSLQTGLGLNEPAAYLLILACLPNLLLQILTWAGIVLAPTLTAPAVVEEIKSGTWDILRLTPYSMRHLLVAKLLGALSRLKIWVPILVVNGLQLLIGLGTAFYLFFEESFGAALLSLVGMGLLMTRPWLEIGFAALVGLLFSTWTRSARGALAGSFAVVMGTKIVNGWLLWSPLVLIGFRNPDFESAAIGLVIGGPALGYAVLLAVVLFLLNVRASVLEREWG